LLCGCFEQTAPYIVLKTSGPITSGEKYSFREPSQGANSKNSDSKATTTYTATDFEDRSGSLGHMGIIRPSSRDDKDVERRSQRVMLKVSVVVLAHGAGNKRVSEETRTVTVNAHGAMILLGMKVSVGQILMLRHCGTGEEVSCRVVYLSPHQAEKREVGVDFMKASPGFWRISFPPPDWTVRSPEAKSSPGPSSPKKNSKTKK
jgi:hypothetical protein